MRAAGEHIPRLVCSLARDEQLGLRILSHAGGLGDLDDAEGERFEMLRSSEQAFLHQRLPGEEAECSSSVHDDFLSVFAGSDDGSDLLFEPRFRFAEVAVLPSSCLRDRSVSSSG